MGLAFAARQRLWSSDSSKVRGKVQRDCRITKLLDMAAPIAGAIVPAIEGLPTRTLIRKIVDKKADYVLALKGNQGRCAEDVEVFRGEAEAAGVKDTGIRRTRRRGDHGRIETGTQPDPRYRLDYRKRRMARSEGHRHGRKYP